MIRNMSMVAPFIALATAALALHGQTARLAAASRSAYFTTSDGIRLHYLEAGSGPALVLVPGWTMPARIFAPQLEGLARDFRVIALDPRSQGESQQTAEGHYPERRARDIAELLSHLRLDAVILGGWSLGVPEVLTCLDRHGAASVRAVILIDGFVGADAKAGAPNPLAPVLSALQRDRRAFTAEFVKSMYRTPQTEAYLKSITDASLATPTNTAFTLLGNLLIGPGDWRPVLRGLDRPVLYVVTPQLAEQAEMVRQTKPDAQVEVFAEAGHALFVDEAERFNGLIREFARRVWR